MNESDSISVLSAWQSPASQKRGQNDEAGASTAPGLYIVATPIGNLRDISLRALDILSSADMILAEDTRRSRKLLTAYGFDTPLTAYHDHNVAKQLPKIISALKDGKIIAQISDAGTPLISDPGFKLVREAISQNLAVYPVPGASAPLAALMAAGLPTDRFLFAGFLPPKMAARRKVLTELGSIKSTLIFFETPHRLAASLTDISDVLGSRELVIARELTKKYEELRRGLAQELLAGIKSDPPRGEIVLMIAPPETDEKWSAAQIDEALKELLAEKGTKQASKDLSSLSGWPVREIYQRATSRKTGPKK